MDILTNLKQLFTRSYVPDVTVPLSTATPSLFSHGSSSESQYINQEQALTVSAYYAAIRTISEEVGAFPRHLYRKDAAKGRVEITDTPAAKLLRNPNTTLYTSFTFWQTLTRNALQYGNGYAQIIRTNSGTPTSLVLIHPNNVEPKIVNDELVYDIRNSGAVRRLLGYQMLHVVGFSENGLVGTSPIQYHAQTLNTGRFAAEFTTKYFENGATPSGVLEMPGKLSAEAGPRLRTQFAELISRKNNHKPLLLEDGLSFKPMSVDPEKSQLIELKKYNVEDVARIFRIPLSKLQNNEKANYNSLEAENTAFVTETLLPWCRKIEEEFERKLLTAAEQGSVYCRFSVDGRARGTLAERNAAYTAGRNGGWLSANEIRELENQDRIEGGDTYLSPLNMTTANLEKRTNPTPPPPSQVEGAVDSSGGGSSSTGAIGQPPTPGMKAEALKLIAQAEATARQLATKEAKALQVALKAPSFLEKQANYRLFINDHSDLVEKQFQPLLDSASELKIKLPPLKEIYLKASEKVFAERLQAEFSVDEYINKLVDAFTAVYKG